MESVVFCCQICKTRLALTGVEQMSPSGGIKARTQNDKQKPTRTEDSFVVLESRKKESGLLGRHNPHFPFGILSIEKKGGKHSIDESFVVLGPLSSGSQREIVDTEGNLVLCFQTTILHEIDVMTLGAPDIDDKLKALVRIFEVQALVLFQRYNMSLARQRRKRNRSSFMC